MTKHAPGPWAAIPSTPQDGVNCWWVHGASGVDIAIVIGPQNSETEADARLIAAAPDLLEALHACVVALERADTSEGVCCCGDSMAGHPDPFACGHAPVDAGDYYAGKTLLAARAILAKATGAPE